MFRCEVSQGDVPAPARIGDCKVVARSQTLPLGATSTSYGLSRRALCAHASAEAILLWLSLSDHNNDSRTTDHSLAMPKASRLSMPSMLFSISLIVRAPLNTKMSVSR